MVDAALITLVDILVGIGAALILAVLHVPSELKTILAVIGAAAYILGSILYSGEQWQRRQCPSDAGAHPFRVMTEGVNSRMLG